MSPEGPLKRGNYVRVCLTAALALLASLAFSGVASAHHPAGTSACGQVVTGDLTLTHDVGPCPAASGTNGAALTIKGSGTSSGSPPTTSTYLTVDLAGHKVFGCDDATPQGPCNSLNVNDPSLEAPFVTGEGPGIVIDDGQNDVKITDSGTGGTVSNFDTGIVVRGGDRNVIEKLDVKQNVGTAATNSDYGEGIGIYTGSTGSTHNKVSENVVEGNGPFAGVALYNFDDRTGAQATACATTDNTVGGPNAADKNTVKDNYVVPNGTTFQDDGIRVEPDVCKTLVENNEVSGSSLDGIAVFAKAVNTEVKNNLVTGNGSQPLATQRKGDGIAVFSTANGCTVSGNTVGGNAGNGIRVDADGCTISSNSVSGNAFNELVNGQPVSDPRGDAAKATNTESQYAYYDLKDGQADKRCGAGPITVPPSAPQAIRNMWTGHGAAATRNRTPAVTELLDCIG